MGGLVALICIGVMAVPTVPVAAGAAASAGVEVTTGASAGLMMMFTLNVPTPAPAELVAPRTSVYGPLEPGRGTPLIRPLAALTDTPAGNPVAV